MCSSDLVTGAVALAVSEGVEVVDPVPDTGGVLDAEAPAGSVAADVDDGVAESDAVDDPLSDAAVGVWEGVGAAVPVGDAVALPVGELDGVSGAEAVELSDGVDDDEVVPD